MKCDCSWQAISDGQTVTAMGWRTCPNHTPTAWDRLSEAQWEATCQLCRRDEHEECLLAVRVDGLLVPCACGCLKDGRGRE